MVIPRRYIRNNRPKNVKGGAMANLLLNPHIVFYLVEWHVPRPFDDHLTARRPRPVRQGSDRVQFAQLRLITRVGQRPRAQPVAQAGRLSRAAASRRCAIGRPILAASL